MCLGGGLHCQGRLYKRPWLCTKGRATLHPFHRPPLNQGVPDRAHRIAVPDPCEGVAEVRVKGCDQPPIPESPPSGGGGEGSNGGCIR